MEVNFELRPEFKRAFDNLDPKAILQSLGFMGLNPPHGARALWLFDEIQECPQAVTALRYFFEQMPELPIVATGSLLEFTLSQSQLSMPVGRVESLWLGPMTFHEFLHAEGRADLAEHLANASPFASESVLAADQAAKWLPSYFFCGGMPEAVKTWTENQDTEVVGRVHLGLLQTYRAEVDFVIAAGPRVIPIEVKGGATGSLKSLRSFLSSHPNTPFGIRLFTAAATKHEDIYSLPLCYAGSLQQHVPRWAAE